MDKAFNNTRKYSNATQMMNVHVPPPTAEDIAQFQAKGFHIFHTPILSSPFLQRCQRAIHRLLCEQYGGSDESEADSERVAVAGADRACEHMSSCVDDACKGSKKERTEAENKKDDAAIISVEQQQQQQDQKQQQQIPSKVPSSALLRAAGGAGLLGRYADSCPQLPTISKRQQKKKREREKQVQTEEQRQLHEDDVAAKNDVQNVRHTTGGTTQNNSMHLSSPTECRSSMHQSQHQHKPLQTIHFINSHRCAKAVRELAVDPGIGRAVCELMQWPGCRFAEDQLWLKPAGAGALSFHRDTPYFDFVPKEVATVWLPLDDLCGEAGRALGPLEYCDGSHRWSDARRGSASAFFHKKKQTPQQTNAQSPTRKHQPLTKGRSTTVDQRRGIAADSLEGTAAETETALDQTDEMMKHNTNCSSIHVPEYRRLLYDAARRERELLRGECNDKDDGSNGETKLTEQPETAQQEPPGSPNMHRSLTEERRPPNSTDANDTTPAGIKNQNNNTRNDSQHQHLHITVVEVPAGGASIHNGKTWHGSGANCSGETAAGPRPRRGIGMHYIRSDAVYAEEIGPLWRKQDASATPGCVPSTLPLVWPIPSV